VVVAAESPTFFASLLGQLISITCGGQPSSPLFGCVSNGQLCSNHGTCPNSACICASGWEGTFCQTAIKSSATSTTTIIAATLGSVLPAILLLICLAVGIVAAVVLIGRRYRMQGADWEISLDELEMEQHLGTGGYGEVYKAKWRGTEVAVKTMAAEVVTKEMQKCFTDEVRRNNTTPVGGRRSQTSNLINKPKWEGEGNDLIEASQRGAVHGRIDEAT
jgi:hypothetical protein